VCTGAQATQRIAAPFVGGLVSATPLVILVVFAWWRGRSLPR